MTICEHCGADKPERYSRGALTIISAPPSVFWRGHRFAITPTQYRILEPLVRYGSVSMETLEYRVFPDSEDSRRSAQTHIVYLRRRLKAAGCPYLIVNDYGWGYELVLREDPSTPSSAHQDASPAAG